jgi:hypothetical protein
MRALFNVRWWAKKETPCGCARGRRDAVARGHGGNLALAQTPAQTSPEVAINLGGRGWSSPSSNGDEDEALSR